MRHLVAHEGLLDGGVPAHPPYQIDGNFGGAAGIAEMLMQSRVGEIELLPALPKAGPSGSVKGLRTRGGFEVDVTWKVGELVKSGIRSLIGGSTQLRCGSDTRTIELSKGKSTQWNGQ